MFPQRPTAVCPACQVLMYPARDARGAYCPCCNERLADPRQQHTRDERTRHGGVTRKAKERGNE